MTFELLKKIIQVNNIPENVTLESNSGWECSATDMNGAYYNSEENVLVFTQYTCSHDDYYNKPEWKMVYGKKESWDDDFDDRRVINYD